MDRGAVAANEVRDAHPRACVCPHGVAGAARRRLGLGLFVVVPALLALSSGGCRPGEVRSPEVDSGAGAVSDTRSGEGRAGCAVGTLALTQLETRVFYSSDYAVLPQTCGSLAELRTCSNGALSGSFSNPECSLHPAPTVLLAGEAVAVEPSSMHHATAEGVQSTWMFDAAFESSPGVLDLARIQPAIEQVITDPQAQGYAFIDLEEPYLEHLRSPGTAAFEATQREFVALIALAKRARPGVKWGFYGFPTIRYWPQDEQGRAYSADTAPQPVIDKELANALAAVELFAAVDFISPSFYKPYPRDKVAGSARWDEAYMQLVAKGVRQAAPSKPLLAFISERYFNGNAESSHALIPEREFQEMSVLKPFSFGVAAVVYWSASSYWFRLYRATGLPPSYDATIARINVSLAGELPAGMSSEAYVQQLLRRRVALIKEVAPNLVPAISARESRAAATVSVSWTTRNMYACSLYGGQHNATILPLPITSGAVESGPLSTESYYYQQGDVSFIFNCWDSNNAFHQYGTNVRLLQ